MPFWTQTKKTLLTTTLLSVANLCPVSCCPLITLKTNLSPARAKRKEGTTKTRARGTKGQSNRILTKKVSGTIRETMRWLRVAGKGRIITVIMIRDIPIIRRGIILSIHSIIIRCNSSHSINTLLIIKTMKAFNGVSLCWNYSKTTSFKIIIKTTINNPTMVIYLNYKNLKNKKQLKPKPNPQFKNIFLNLPKWT